MIGLNRVKTWILIAALGGAVRARSGRFGGTNGMVLALGIALVFNFSMYWFSDKIAIATTRSKPVTEQEAPELYRIVRELTQTNNMPMPRIYVSEMHAAERVRDGTEPAARRRGRDAGDPGDPRRARAPGGPGTRALPCGEPRHPGLERSPRRSG